MLLKFKFLKKNIIYKILILSSILNPFFTLFLLRNNSVYGEETATQKNKIKWEKLEINNKFNKSNIIWQNYDELESNSDTDYYKINNKEKEVELKQFNQQTLKKKTISSLNRSIVFDDKKIGPDLSFLVPIGFKSINDNFLDISIRGWNRRPKNSNLFQLSQSFYKH